MASSELAEGVASSALAEGVAAALELSKALEAKLEGAARSEAAALTACLAGLVSGGGDGGAAAGDGAAAAGDGGAAGAELAAAAATSCMVPRGKFDLRLHDGAPNTLHGIVSPANLPREPCAPPADRRPLARRPAPEPRDGASRWTTWCSW